MLSQHLAKTYHCPIKPGKTCFFYYLKHTKKQNIFFKNLFKFLSLISVMHTSIILKTFTLLMIMIFKLSPIDILEKRKLSHYSLATTQELKFLNQLLKKYDKFWFVYVTSIVTSGKSCTVSKHISIQWLHLVWIPERCCITYIYSIWRKCSRYILSTFDQD